MRPSTIRRLILLGVGILIVVSFLVSRDTIKADARLSKAEIKQMVSQIETWSGPMLKRNINIEITKDGLAAVWLRESEKYSSVTVFTNSGGAWRKTVRYMVEHEKSIRGK